jgi:hypothetical protein
MITRPEPERLSDGQGLWLAKGAKARAGAEQRAHAGFVKGDAKGAAAIVARTPAEARRVTSQFQRITLGHQ